MRQTELIEYGFEMARLTRRQYAKYRARKEETTDPGFPPKLEYRQTKLKEYGAVPY